MFRKPCCNILAGPLAEKQKMAEDESVIDFEASTGDLGNGPSTRWSSNHVVVGGTSDQGGPDEQCPR